MKVCEPHQTEHVIGHLVEAAGVTGEVLNWFKSYLPDRRQRIVLPGVSSVWNFIRAGVSQGSILRPLLFLLFINDIVNGIDSSIRLFADDTSLFIILDNVPYATACLNLDVDQITRLAVTWLVTFNPSKSEALLLSRKLNTIQHPPFYHMENVQIQVVKSHKHLGLYLLSDCSWNQHKFNVKHVLKSAPLPASLQHSVKQYNLKISHVVFPSLFVCIVSFYIFFTSILILRNYFLLIVITLHCILTL